MSIDDTWKDVIRYKSNPVEELKLLMKQTPAEEQTSELYTAALQETFMAGDVGCFRLLMENSELRDAPVIVHALLYTLAECTNKSTRLSSGATTEMLEYLLLDTTLMINKQLWQELLSTSADAHFQSELCRFEELADASEDLEEVCHELVATCSLPKSFLSELKKSFTSGTLHKMMKLTNAELTAEVVLQALSILQTTTTKQCKI